MAGSHCPRAWQSEAASDGRLSGKDLEAALRHRKLCTECAAEQRELAALTRSISSLPVIPRDPLTVRRCRQRLLTTLNASLVGPTRSRSVRWAPILALIAFGVLACVLSIRLVRAKPAFLHPVSAVEVHASLGARWHIASQIGMDRVEFDEGVATFEVHPHLGRRVIVVLPDGQLEDLGTTFQVSVSAGHTDRIAVSRGRVLVRFAGRPQFSVQVGEQWRRGESPATAVPANVDIAKLAVAPRTAASASLGAPRKNVARPRQSAPASALPSRTPEDIPRTPEGIPRTLESSEHASKRVEDAAYLAVLSALREQRFAEARARAKAYLLDFPSGFRRVEVLNIAIGGASTPPPLTTASRLHVTSRERYAIAMIVSPNRRPRNAHLAAGHAVRRRRVLPASAIMPTEGAAR